MAHHRCIIEGCGRPIPPRYALCPQHQRALPRDLRAPVQTLYHRRRQGSATMQQALGAAQSYLSSKEGIRP